MKPSSVKQILTAAALLPAPQARRVVGAVLEKQSTGPHGMEALRAALNEDLAPLGDALMGAWKASDLPAMQAALKKISKRMPEMSGDADALSAELSKQLFTALETA